jgi:hypothetical protein
MTWRDVIFRILLDRDIAVAIIATLLLLLVLNVFRS